MELLEATAGRAKETWARAGRNLKADLEIDLSALLGPHRCFQLIKPRFVDRESPDASFNQVNRLQTQHLFVFHYPASTAAPSREEVARGRFAG